MVQSSLPQPGLGLPEQQATNVDQQQLPRKGAAGTEHSVVRTENIQESQILQGSSSAAGTGEVHVENSVIGTTTAGAAGVIQRTATAKMCRRCGVKGHLICSIARRQCFVIFAETLSMP